ncbi:MAG: aminotransferase class IV [Phycisphaerales bacterium]|nr:aminotransferase class IV [Phycisphaerales bacterium]MCB9854320.1 aminotransferase class IV [Phycisphaerales bacterium]MCB9863521.1 aminotransferase class IV [Phycisphaerales bacterium]
MSEHVYLNGHIVPAESATISVFDGGFTHAAGLWETMRAYNGRIMRFGEHIDRLNRSARILEISVSLDAESIDAGITELLAANNLEEARVRVVATPGSIPRPGAETQVQTGPTTLITATPPSRYPPELYKTGFRVCISPYRQSRLDPVAGHKTLAYLPRLLSMKDAAERRCNESLWFTTENLLAEGAVCNVFIVKSDSIATPPLDTPVLPGATRHAVIDLARENGIVCEEKAIDIDILLGADEVFLTGSVLEIMPVTAIEKHQVGKGEPGEMTKRISSLYGELVERECGRYVQNA